MTIKESLTQIYDYYFPLLQDGKQFTIDGWIERYHNNDKDILHLISVHSITIKESK